MERQQAEWTLLSNHGAALLFVAEHGDATVREIGDAVGVTERSAARILRDLRDGGYVHARRVGRRNTYQLKQQLPLRHQAGKGHNVAELLAGLVRVESAS